MMLGAIFIAIIAIVILIFAGRIILGWVLPAPAMLRVDRAAKWAANLYLKLIVVAIAGGIVYMLWVGFS